MARNKSGWQTAGDVAAGIGLVALAGLAAYGGAAAEVARQEEVDKARRNASRINTWASDNSIAEAVSKYRRGFFSEQNLATEIEAHQRYLGSWRLALAAVYAESDRSGKRRIDELIRKAEHIERYGW